jgi:catechol 2,3-dioxygenase-like lactoylglutathione lyase family enzyme
MAGVHGRIFHVNVNCSDLETSLAFYRDRAGLAASVRTTPRHPQAGAAFGLETAQWDAWIMSGGGPDEVVLDLLEWKVPRPSHPRDPGGFRRLRVGAYPDSLLASEEAVDPDGTALEIVARDGPRVAGVVVGCSDLGASQAFYRDVLGLSSSGTSTYADARGPEVFSIELTSVAAAPRPRIATDLGLYRLAMLTDDLDHDYDALTAAGVRPYSPPANLDMGPGLPQLRALFFPDPDGTTFELIEQPAVGNTAGPGPDWQESSGN